MRLFIGKNQHTGSVYCCNPELSEAPHAANRAPFRIATHEATVGSVVQKLNILIVMLLQKNTQSRVVQHKENNSMSDEDNCFTEGNLDGQILYPCLDDLDEDSKNLYLDVIDACSAAIKDVYSAYPDQLAPILMSCMWHQYTNEGFETDFYFPCPACLNNGRLGQALPTTQEQKDNYPGWLGVCRSCHEDPGHFCKYDSSNPQIVSFCNYLAKNYVLDNKAPFRNDTYDEPN